MPAVKSEEEVYKKYIQDIGYDGDGDPDAIALFSFALVEKDKHDWMTHFREVHNGAGPDLTQVEQWYLDKPNSYFDEKLQYALRWCKAFARSLLADEMEEQKKYAVKEYIGEKLSFLPQLWISLTTNAIFVIIVGAIAAYVFMDFSPISWVKTHVTKSGG